MVGKRNEYGLLPQQELFCKKYVECANGYKSYIFAYPNSKKWKRGAVDNRVYNLLKNEQIQSRIEQLNNEATEKLLKSTRISKRRLLESGLQALEETQASGSSERQAFINLLKLLLQQQGYMPATGGTQIQVNIQNNAVINDVSKYLDI